MNSKTDLITFVTKSAASGVSLAMVGLRLLLISGNIKSPEPRAIQSRGFLLTTTRKQVLKQKVERVKNEKNRDLSIKNALKSMV